VRCEEEGCRKYASFGDASDANKRFCSVHKKSEHVDLKNPRCMFPEGCALRATYGARCAYAGGPGSSADDVIAERCNSCNSSSNASKTAHNATAGTD
jgi:hypothetical protein